MKKVFTLFAAALLGLCAFAQEGPCPSRLYFEPAADEQPANNATFLLKLVNSSENLNGFNMEVQKPEAAVWVEDADDEDWVGFSGYGHTILARWEGVTDSKREQQLFKKADLKCSIKDGKLVIIEILSTEECRFFPILEEPAGIARFTLDMSGCADGVYALMSEATPTGCSFSFTGGPEGNRAWTTDAPIYLELKKDGDKVIPTAISTIAVDETPADNRIFDLQGRELNRVPDSGIYIQNGKKYVK